MARVRVFVLTGDKFRRIGLREVLAADPEIAVLDMHSESDDPAAVARLLPDVVIVDAATLSLELPAYLRVFKKASPHSNFLLIGTDSSEDVVSAFRAGVKGFVNILQCADEVAGAVKAVYRGHAWIARRTMGQLIDEVAFELARDRRAGTKSQPTASERRVLELLAREGLSNKQIAAHLEVQERTVEFHISSLLRKFLVTNRNQLIIYAIKQGLVA
jgi:DNA-binding NarL/FixJ family response regulator